VSFDNYAASVAVVDHLASLGHRRIVLVCGRTDVNDRALARRKGFEDRMKALRLPFSPDDIRECEFDFTEGRKAVRAFLDRSSPPTAIFSANDIVAVGALYECQRLGLRVPEDISIVGFDDLPLAQYVFPQLTSVRVPAADMGNQAVEMLLELIGGKTVRSRALPTEIIARGTVAPPAKRRSA
jgi:DNA-binding LacI/PurR family transcriptional regulator